MSTLDDVYKLVDAGEEDTALDFVYDTIDDLFQSGKFNEVDSILERVDLFRLSPTVSLGLLSITSAAKHLLHNRAELYRRIELLLQRTDPLRTKELLKGLE